MASLKNKDKAFELLKNYKGNNPYILMLKRNVFINNQINDFGDFQVEYILSNYDFEPKLINKIILIADWYGEKKKDDWNLDFTPQKLKIVSFLGETKTTYNCYVIYRRSQEKPKLTFIPKSAVLTNFLAEDYHNVEVDFEKYDKITLLKDENRRLKEHQKEAIKFLLSRKKCILADGMGLGKTNSLIVSAIEGNFDSVLIICPASIKTTWKRELMWYVDSNNISVIQGILDKNKNELMSLLGYSSDIKKTKNELLSEAKEIGKWRNNKFVIVNYDILSEFYKIPESNSKENINKAFDESPMLQYIVDKKSLIIIDEAHRLSNTSSIRYKIIKDLIKRGNPNSIYEATGTPITNRPINLFNVLSFLGDPITDDWEYFCTRYCNGFRIPAKGEKEKYTNIFLEKYNKKSFYDLSQQEKNDLKSYIDENARKIMINNGASNLEELKNRISHIYLRRVKEDMPDMVNKTIHEIYYDLTALEEKEYKKLWDEYEASQLEEDPSKELNQDLLEGAIYRRYISNIMIPHTINLVNDFLEDEEKVIIATCYDEELYTLQNYYKDKCVIYNGKMTPKQKDVSEKEFMTNPNIKIFIGNIQAAGVGLTLTSANKMVFNNMSFVSGDNSQMCDRIHRISQTKDVDIYFQIFNNTQYEHIWKIVMKKEMVINKIIKKEDDK